MDFYSLTVLHFQQPASRASAIDEDRYYRDHMAPIKLPQPNGLVLSLALILMTAGALIG